MRAGADGLLRSRLAWAVAGYFGSQSLIAYVMFGWLPLLLRDNGYTAGEAGLVLAVFTGLGIPVSMAVPALATRLSGQRPLVIAFSVLYAAGFAGLLTGHALWAWSILVAVGGGTFPLALAMLAMRTRTPAGTAALSAFGQSAGYLIAGAGPITFGLLHQVSGGWALPFVLLFAALAVQVVTGWYAAADRTLEDETPPVPAGGRDDHVSRGVRDLVTGQARRPAGKARHARTGDGGKAARPRLARPAGRHEGRRRSPCP